MAAALRGLYANAPDVLATPARAVGAALTTTTSLAARGYAPANGAVYPATTLGKALRDVARLVKGKVGLAAAASTSATGTCTRASARRSRASGCTTT